MKAFTLIQPRTLEDTLTALAHENTKLLAGGQDLLTEMKEHLVEPERVVNLKGVGGLDRIELDAQGNARLGALVTVAALEQHEGLRARLPVLTEAATSVASPQIRSIGTLGGNLCQRPRCWYYRNENAKCLKKGGDECFSYSGLNKYNAILGGGPSYIVHPSDLAPALVALGAEVVLRSPRGERKLPIESFFVLPSVDSKHENVLAPDEVLIAVNVPAPEAGSKSTYLKFRERGSFDFALSSVALVLSRDGSRVKRARIALGGVAPVPWRAHACEKALEGRELNAESIEAAAKASVVGAEALGQNDYKIPLTRGLVARALQSLA